jgi:hypothetical protein
MARIAASWPMTIAVGLVLFALAGCSGGTWTQSQEDWLRSASGPFTDSSNGGRGGGGGGFGGGGGGGHGGGHR